MRYGRMTQADIAFILTVLVCISIPLPIRLNSLVIVATFSMALLYFVTTWKEDKRRLHRYFLIMIGLYLIHFVAFLNSENLKPVWFDLEEKATIIAFPLMFAIGPKYSEFKITLILKSFIISIFIVTLLSFRNGFYLGYRGEQLYESLLVKHPYLAMYCLCCIFFALEILRTHKEEKTRWVYGLAAIYFALFVFVLFAKMAIITMVLLLFAYLIWTLLTKKKYRTSVAILACVFSLLLYALVVNRDGRMVIEKIITFSPFDWQHYDPTLVNSINLRFAHWNCSADVLSKDCNWFFGVGTGDVKAALNECYAAMLGQDSFFVKKAYNSHNNYFTVWLDLGLVPLILFLFHFFAALYLYARMKDITAFMFTLCVMMLCLTESIFEVQKGIVFYAFFQTLFLFRLSGREPRIKFSNRL